MSRIFDNREITKTQKLYKLIPYEEEITVNEKYVVGRKCDLCNHIFNHAEFYFDTTINKDPKDSENEKALYYDLCIKCCETELIKYLYEIDSFSMEIYKAVNYNNEFKIV